MTYEELVKTIKAEIYPNGSENITGQMLQDTLVRIAQAGVSPSGDPMHQAYEAVGAVWNDSTGFWELNGLTDITNDQMREIYVVGIGCFNKADWREAFHDSKVRTNIPSVGNNGQAYGGVEIDGAFLSATKIEVVQFLKNPEKEIRIGSNLYLAFGNTPNLKRIENPILLTFVKENEMNYADTFSCPLCTKLLLKALKYSTNLGKMESISLESLTYLVDNAANTKAITVTVHPTVYGYLTDQAGHPEWHKLAQAAAEKQISFVAA